MKDRLWKYLQTACADDAVQVRPLMRHQLEQLSLNFGSTSARHAGGDKDRLPSENVLSACLSGKTSVLRELHFGICKLFASYCLQLFFEFFAIYSVATLSLICLTLPICMSLGGWVILVPAYLSWGLFRRVGSGSNNMTRPICLIGLTLSGSDTAK